MLALKKLVGSLHIKEKLTKTLGMGPTGKSAGMNTRVFASLSNKQVE